MPKKEVPVSLAQFEDKLSWLWGHRSAISRSFVDNLPLNSRYQYDAQTGEFHCKGKKKFISYVENSSEKNFYALLNPNDPQLNLAQYLSEPALVRYYLIYCWAADFAHKNKLDPEWEKLFVAKLQQEICQQEKRHLDDMLSHHQSEWSAAKNKLYGLLINNTSQIISLEQKTHHYHQLAKQAHQKHFYHDGTKQHVFYRYADAVTRYEYEAMMQELSEAMQPILYYPESDQQQANLCEYARHCFFLDKDTKEFKYINSSGTVFRIPSTQLLAKTEDQIKPVKGGKWALPYVKKGKGLDHFDVDKTTSTEFGAAFSVDSHMMQIIVPDGLPQDPIIKLAESTLKNTKEYFFSLQRTLSLFGQDHVLAFQHRIAGLIQIKEMLQGKTTRVVRETHTRPNMADFMGRGRNTYVFFDNPSDPDSSEFWHVDSSNDTPVLTQFPMDDIQTYYFYQMFCGAKSAVCPDEANDIPDAKKWYELGQHAQRQKDLGSEGVVICLDSESARKIPELLLSDMKIYRHLLEDRTYFETSNELVDLLETMEKTPENTRLIERCRNIHEHLELIAKDRLHSFPDSRGVVPPAKRQKIMQMMMDVIRDKNSPEAKHYFRKHHRVYQTELDPNQWDNYEPASFVWDGGDKLCYLDEKKNKVDVEMTDSIRRKLLGITANPDPNAQIISANDVYELMTRPRLFYYYCGVPVGLDLRWFDFTYYIPLKFDRSKGLHTGTAQEMLRDIHAHKLSVYNLLYKLGEMLLLMVIPLILASFGIAIPYPALLGKLGATIVEWIFLVWNIEFTFNYIRFTLLMNELAHPELNQLDKMLQDLNAEVEEISALDSGISDEGDSQDLDWNPSSSLLSHKGHFG